MRDSSTTTRRCERPGAAPVDAAVPATKVRAVETPDESGAADVIDGGREWRPDGASAAAAPSCRETRFSDGSPCDATSATGEADAAAAAADAQPALESLTLTSCAQLADASAAAIAVHCPRLTHLSLAYCSRVTDAGLYAVITGGSHFLRSLNVSGCSVSSRCLQALFLGMHRLRQLDISACAHLTAPALRGMCPPLLVVQWPVGRTRPVQSAVQSASGALASASSASSLQSSGRPPSRSSAR